MARLPRIAELKDQDAGWGFLAPETWIHSSSVAA